MAGLRIILAAAGFGLALAACDSTGGASLGPVDTGSLVGKWQMTSIREQGREEMKMTSPISKDTVMNTDTTMNYSDPSYYLEFKADNSCNLSQPANPATAKSAAVEPCTWSLSGSTLTLQLTNQAEVTKSQVGITGKILTSVSTVDTTVSFSGVTESMHTVTTVKASKI